MIEYELTSADLLAWANWRAAHADPADPEFRRRRVVAAWLVGAGCYLAVALILTVPWLVVRQYALAGISEVVALAVGAFGGWMEWRLGVSAGWLERRRARLRARVALEKNGSTRRIEVVPDGIKLAAGQQETLLPWEGVTAVIQTPTHLFLQTGPNAAHVVPLSIGLDVAQIRAEVKRHAPRDR